MVKRHVGQTLPPSHESEHQLHLGELSTSTPIEYHDSRFDDPDLRQPEPANNYRIPINTNPTKWLTPNTTQLTLPVNSPSNGEERDFGCNLGGIEADERIFR